MKPLTSPLIRWVVMLHLSVGEGSTSSRMYEGGRGILS
jgi:hypothetical protein